METLFLPKLSSCFYCTSRLLSLLYQYNIDIKQISDFSAAPHTMRAAVPAMSAAFDFAEGFLSTGCQEFCRSQLPFPHLGFLGVLNSD